MTLEKKFRALVERRRKSGHSLADLIKVSGDAFNRSSAKNWENGACNPPVRAVYLYEAALDALDSAKEFAQLQYQLATGRRQS